MVNSSVLDMRTQKETICQMGVGTACHPAPESQSDNGAHWCAQSLYDRRFSLLLLNLAQPSATGWKKFPLEKQHARLDR